MKHSSKAKALVLPLGLCVSSSALAAPTLEDYKYFRTLTIDLVGRMPTRQELDAFEKPEFNMQSWLDSHMQGDDYAERLSRVYSDLMRPQINGLRYTNNRAALSWVTFKAPDGKSTRLYFRAAQSRVRTNALRTMLNADATYKSCTAIRDPVNDPNYVTLGCAKYETYDNQLKTGMCMTADEMGIRANNFNILPTPFPAQAGDKAGDLRNPALQAALDQYTTVVKPWWLYADYKSEAPVQRYDATTWAQRFPGFILANSLHLDVDNKTPVNEIRVCNEEVATALTAVADNPAIKTPVSCITGYGAANSAACGCGPGLEWCMPTASYNPGQPGATFNSSRNVLLGVDDPTDLVGFSLFDWHSGWMAQEPQVYLKDLFQRDGDIREMVTGRHTFVNGPMAQFYRFSARAYWNDADLGQTPLPAADKLPDLSPHDVMTWQRVEDRGPNGAGILSMPFFLYKNATRRARANIVYSLFLCRDFVAPTGLQLPISRETDLTKRAGCAACHQTLEPLASYFSRFVETDWSWLDPKLYPAMNTACKQTNGSIPSGCTTRYDNVFSTKDYGMLRGAYAAPDKADLGPMGIGEFLASKPEYARCAASNIAQSFLGRSLRTEDAALEQEMITALTENGYRVKPMLKVLLNSNAYKSANNMTSSTWRDNGGAQ